jgi:hypothetical protein
MEGLGGSERSRMSQATMEKHVFKRKNILDLVKVLFLSSGHQVLV